MRKKRSSKCKENTERGSYFSVTSQINIIAFFFQMLWEYKRTFSKDQKFEKAVQERFCVADLNLVIFLNNVKILSQ